MLIPDIYLINDSGLEIIKPEIRNANIIVSKSLNAQPKGSFCLYITKDTALIRNLLKRNVDETILEHRVRFMYTGGKIKDYDVPESILAIVPPKTAKAEITLLVKRLLEHISLSHRAWIYETVLQAIIDTSPDMIWVKDMKERHVILNKAFCQTVNKDYDYCLNKEHPDIWDIPWSDYRSPDFVCRASEQEILRTGRTGVFQEPVLTNGTLRQFTTYKTPIYDITGEPLGTCGIGRDVTNISNLGKELDILLSAIPSPAFLCDPDYNIQRMNESAKSLVNIQGSKMDNYSDWKNIFLKKDDTVRIGEGTVFRYLTGTGSTYYAISEREVKDRFDHMTGYLCILRNVTYQCMYDDLLYKAANIDPLTGACNRRYFYNTMEELRGKPVTLLYMDLDNFKKVNDIYGHDKGDEVLIQTVRILKEVFPHYDTVHLGGDEFAILIKGIPDKDILHACSDVIKEKIKELAESSTELGISIGMDSTECLTDTDSFIRNSDTQMYKKKKRKKKHNKKDAGNNDYFRKE